MTLTQTIDAMLLHGHLINHSLDQTLKNFVPLQYRHLILRYSAQADQLQSQSNVSDYSHCQSAH